MKFSIESINDFVDIGSIDPAVLCENLTMASSNAVWLKDENSIEVEVTTNRPDCLSVIGIARECASIFGISFKEPKIHLRETETIIEDNISIINDDFDLCPLYVARCVQGVEICDSPDWMKSYLKNFGVNCINNIVDVTNYIMLQYGQPMHAYDLDKINGKKIIVRLARENETLITLDKTEKQLDGNIIVIADEEKAIGIAGIMGGFDTSITSDTKNILFEAANFNAKRIKNAARKLELKTDASFYFEKSMFPEHALLAVDRACQLLYDSNCAKVFRGKVLKGKSVCSPPIEDIDFEPDRINKFLGTVISREEMKNILAKLGFVIKDKKISVPWYRQDVKNFFDICEEISRLYGYNNIPSQPIKTEIRIQGKTNEQLIEDNIREFLIFEGLNEIITSSFSANKFNFLDLKKPVEILNPFGEESKFLRTGLIDSMINTLSKNIKSNIDPLRMFEIGNIYWENETDETVSEENFAGGFCLEKIDDSARFKFQEVSLCIGMCRDCDFYDLKGVAEKLLQYLGICEYSFKNFKNVNTFHPKRTVSATIGNLDVGIIGQVNPFKIKAFGVKDEIYILEFNLKKIFNSPKKEKKYIPVSKFPSVTRDISFLVENEVLIIDIEKILYENKLKIGELQKFNLFDVYSGDQIEIGMKSVSYSFVFRSNDRTLTDAEVNGYMKRLIQSLKDSLGAVVR